MRCQVKLQVASQGVGPVRLLLVTAQQLQRWRDGEEEGVLAAEARQNVLHWTELTRFGAEPGQTLSLPDPAGGLLWLVGTQAGGGGLRRAAATAIGLIPDGVECSLCWRSGPEALPAREVGAVAEGVWLGSYRFRIGESEDRTPGPCTLVVDEARLGEARAALQRAQNVCEGVFLTRDLVNTPAGDLGPEELADAALAVARQHGFEATCWRGDEVRERGFGLVEAVGRGSARPSTVTVLRLGDPGRAPGLALVGKGVVFDSGGLNLKTAAGMLLMKKDMAGVATVLGALEALGRSGERPSVLAVLPAAENAVGPASYRPGDVLRSFSGKTVEIGNTDAEGRLLLADGLSYARAQQAERLLDVATLTGAARIALGPDVPALFGTDEELVAQLLEVSQAADEPMWRLPLVESYDRWLDTPFADVHHVGSEKRAGAVSAALFLRRFAGDTPWAHVDLYAWQDQALPEAPQGASGMGVRSLVGLLEQRAAVGA